MCRVTAMLASAMLLCTGFVGPLFHLHEVRQHEHDATGIHTHFAVIHTHLEVHLASSGRNGQCTFDIPHEDGAASQVSLCVFEQKAPALMPLLVERGFIAQTFTEFAPFVATPTPQAHDPPTVDSVDARAPPA